ncbi:MAG: phage tail tape measure protein, partial [Dysosmobacter sp.]|nr:phage tail tape measure protein [Dysosmobacter sp.]
VDAVKGGLQRIRNMLPFSDAKEGPLSTLTLSGQRTMTTYANGLALAQDAPAAAIEQGLRGAKAALEWDPVEKVRVSYGSNEEDGGSAEGAGSGGGGKQVNIKNLVIRMDPRTVKELQTVFSLIREIEDYTNGCGEDPDGEPDLM